MPVGNLGPDDVVTAEPDTELVEIAETLESETVGAAVVAEDDEPVGIVTDRDVALAITESADVSSFTAADVMAEDPVTLQEDEEAMEIARTIDAENIRRVPVTDESGTLTGIVTLDDLVATVGEQLDHVSETIESQSPEYSP